MRVAPAMRAPCTIEIPMPPAPITSTVAPSGTRAVLSTAPTPVCTAQPMTHTTSSGVSSATLMAPDTGVITSSAKPARPDAAQHRRAVTRERRAAVHQRARHDPRVVHAAAVLAAHAPVALVARGDRRQHDLVAHRELGDVGADGLDYAGGLVPEHGGSHHGERPVGEREVGVTHPAVTHSYEDFARTRVFDVDVADDFERLLRGFEQGGAHGQDASFSRSSETTRGQRAWTSSTSG